MSMSIYPGKGEEPDFSTAGSDVAVGGRLLIAVAAVVAMMEPEMKTLWMWYALILINDLLTEIDT